MASLATEDLIVAACLAVGVVGFTAGGKSVCSCLRRSSPRHVRQVALRKLMANARLVRVYLRATARAMGIFRSTWKASGVVCAEAPKVSQTAKSAEPCGSQEGPKSADVPVAAQTTQRCRSVQHCAALNPPGKVADSNNGMPLCPTSTWRATGELRKKNGTPREPHAAPRSKSQQDPKDCLKPLTPAQLCRKLLRRKSEPHLSKEEAEPAKLPLTAKMSSTNGPPRLHGRPTASPQQQKGEQSRHFLPSRGVGAGKARGKGSPPPLPPRGKGNPPLALPPQFQGKSSAMSSTGLARQDPSLQANSSCLTDTPPSVAAPFGKRLHWVKPLYGPPEHSTAFTADGVRTSFDPQLLTEVLGGQSPSASSSASPASRRRFTLQSNPGVRVLDSTRAQNVAIALSRLQGSVEELCHRLQTMDFEAPGLHPDDVERLLGKLPTHEEAARILQHQGRPEALRDIEQKLLPLCKVPGCERRLKLAHVALTHAMQYSCLLKRIEILCLASQEILSSNCVRELLQMVLKVANYINHGNCEGAKAISVKSLQAFASFKVGSASALNYLRISLCSDEFLSQLEKDLAHVPLAARESQPALRQDLEAFQQGLSLLESWLAEAAREESTTSFEGAKLQIAKLRDSVRSENVGLQHAYQRARSLGDQAKQFCGEEQSRPTSAEECFSCISDFIGLIAGTNVHPGNQHSRATVSRSSISSILRDTGHSDVQDLADKSSLKL